MKSFLSICLLLASTQIALAQDEAAAKPTKEHARLAATTGVWDAEIIMSSPDGKTASTGVETVKMVGELWTISSFEYEFMGVPTQGHGTMGYDPSKGKYVGTWIESTNPHMSTMEGEYDEEKKAVVYQMKSNDAGGNEMEFRVITATQDETHRTFELHAKIDEDQFVKVLEMNYTKRDEK